MGTKTEPGRFDCYGKALPDEPVFVLLGRDPQAPGLVLMWAAERETGIAEGRYPESDREKVAEARAWAHGAKAWRDANDGAWRQQNPELPGLPARAAAMLDEIEPDAEQRAAVIEREMKPRTADMGAVAEAQRGPNYPEL